MGDVYKLRELALKTGKQIGILEVVKYLRGKISDETLLGIITHFEKEGVI